MRSLKILVAEDDAMIALFLKDLLTSMGHVVCEIAETEAEAIAAAKRHNPDLMIVDANLHEGSGVAAVAQIIRSAALPHIFVTGDLYSLVGLQPGAIVVQKPFMQHELVRAITRAIMPAAAKVTAERAGATHPSA